MNEPAIVVQGLTKRFGDLEALKGVDFEVQPGTIFGLLGPNGAGKTTIVRILSTILTPDSGSVRVLGRDVVKQADEVRFLIGLAGQNAAVDGNLTGRENLRLIGRLAQIPKAHVRPRADELLERFDLSAAADRTVRTYSGGMRRRLDVAAALVGSPPVLFLDEPTTGLDVQSRTELWSVIRELVAVGSTVLLTTQYLEEADRLANPIAVVDGGRVVANDSGPALKARLGGTVIELVMKNERAGIRTRKLLTDLTGGHVELEGVTVSLTSDDAPHVLSEALRSLDEKRLKPANISVREPSLDDVFLVLTGHTPVSANGAKP